MGDSQTRIVGQGQRDRNWDSLTGTVKQWQSDQDSKPLIDRPWQSDPDSETGTVRRDQWYGESQKRILKWTNLDSGAKERKDREFGSGISESYWESGTLLASQSTAMENEIDNVKCGVKAAMCHILRVTWEERTLHSGPEESRIKTEILGHSLVRSLVRSLAHFAHSLARGTVID